ILPPPRSSVWSRGSGAPLAVRRPRSAALSGGVAAFRQPVLQDGGGDFLDRLRGRREPADSLAAHQPLGLRDLVQAVFQGRVSTVWATFAPHFRQAFG